MQILDWETDVKILAALEKDEDDYPAITLLEKSAIAAIESYILRTIKKTTVTQYFEFWEYLLPLDAVPIISITSIVADDGTTFTTDDYKKTKWGLEFYKSSAVDSPLTVVYQGGFSKIPSDIYRAILLQTVYEWQNRDHIGASYVVTDGGSIQVPSLQLLPEVIRLIKNYKHPMKAFL